MKSLLARLEPCLVLVDLHLRVRVRGDSFLKVKVSWPAWYVVNTQWATSSRVLSLDELGRGKKKKSRNGPQSYVLGLIDEMSLLRCMNVQKRPHRVCWERWVIWSHGVHSERKAKSVSFSDRRFVHCTGTIVRIAVVEAHWLQGLYRDNIRPICHERLG